MGREVEGECTVCVSVCLHMYGPKHTFRLCYTHSGTFLRAMEKIK